MTTIPTNTLIVAVLLIALVIGVIAWYVMQKQRSLKQRQRFGPEYDLTVSEFRPRIRPDSF
jgi:CHASE1-domain containing sensor protein